MYQHLKHFEIVHHLKPDDSHFFFPDLCSCLKVEEKCRADVEALASVSAAGTDADEDVVLWGSSGASLVFELAEQVALV